MRRPIVIALAATLLTPFSCESSKSTVPQAFLTARTVAVTIDPDAGFSLDDPRANQVAQKDVEAALLIWGRFVPTLNVDQADLIIVIRKGPRKLAAPRSTYSRPKRIAILSPGAINTTGMMPSQSVSSTAAKPADRLRLLHHPPLGLPTRRWIPLQLRTRLQSSSTVVRNIPPSTSTTWLALRRTRCSPLPRRAHRPQIPQAIEEAEKAAASKNPRSPESPPATCHFQANAPNNPSSKSIPQPHQSIDSQIRECIAIHENATLSHALFPFLHPRASRYLRSHPPHRPNRRSTHRHHLVEARLSLRDLPPQLPGLQR